MNVTPITCHYYRINVSTGQSYPVKASFRNRETFLRQLSIWNHLNPNLWKYEEYIPVILDSQLIISNPCG